MESTDDQVNNIVTTAMSDTLGGFLKAWILPITKFAFYGGTVSKESALRMFNFYHDIKKYLDTDGSGWCEPNLEVLKTVAIKISPPRVSYARSMEDQCDYLAYFEKTDTGLKVPTPTITWNDKFSTMFVPLKNQSLISLNSPNSTNALFKYYDAAKSCLSSTKPEDQEEFNRRFESWLIFNVLPHLNDDNLYVGLGNVLSLVNKTSDLCDRLINFYEKKERKPTTSSDICVNFASKKVLIVAIILFLEICWCIPAMFYVMCSKKKKRKRKGKYFNVCVSYDEKSVNAGSMFSGSVPRSRIYNEDYGVKLYQKPRSRNLQHDLNQHQTQNTMAVDSASAKIRGKKKKNSSLNEIQSNVDKCFRLLRKESFCYVCASNSGIETIPTRALPSESQNKIDNLAPTKTVTLFKRNDQSKKYSKELPTIDVNTKKHHRYKKEIENRGYKKSKKIISIPAQSRETKAKYTSNTQPKDSKNSVIKDLKSCTKNENHNDEINKQKSIDEHIACKYNSFKSYQIEKEYSKQQKLKLSNKGVESNVEKPYLELKIERQENERIPSLLDLNENKYTVTTISETTFKKSSHSIHETKIEIKERSLSEIDDGNGIRMSKNSVFDDSHVETRKAKSCGKLNISI
ncbi:unnamed protein product [Parnassius apollo]|uniref:(apollo) hypothetical protein n=1 Tax=Parnassius apollo TaxID=110799 RepID=A0A8S3YGK5_PARAO|nr:unnamed protein product [Parnassius apollo]